MIKEKLTTKFQIPKPNHGITLVALIVTIVVMLILVGVTLSIALGENGIIITAKEAKEKTEIAAEKEKLQNAVFGTIGNNGEVNLENIVLPEGFTEVVGSVSYASKVIYQGPSGQQYQVDKVTGEITEADEENSDESVDLNDGYKVTFGDYEYTYSSSNKGCWSVAVVDKTKEEYGEIATAIYGKPIISLSSTFSGCTNLIKSPEIPNTVKNMLLTYESCTLLKEVSELPEQLTNMNHTFYLCESLKVAPLIPETVTVMTSTFDGCISLIEAPKIPKGVKNLTATFRSCNSLKEAPEIPNGVTNLTSAFQGCSSLTTMPEIPNSVTNMNHAFGYCGLLKTASKIPENVASMSSTFYSCPNLQGEIIVNASPTTYTNCFQNAGTQGTGIVLKGSSIVLNELAATNENGKVTVGN